MNERAELSAARRFLREAVACGELAKPRDAAQQRRRLYLVTSERFEQLMREELGDVRPKVARRSVTNQPKVCRPAKLLRAAA